MGAFSYSYCSSSSSFPRITCRSEERNPPRQMVTNFKGYISPPARGGALKHAILLRQGPAFTTSYASRHVISITDGVISTAERRAQRLGEARLMFKQKEEEKNSKEILVMIDALQRLGLDYHFDQDIAAVLEQLYNDQMTAAPTTISAGDDLFHTSLGFRLLRQHGYNVPSDAFHKFTNEEGRRKIGRNDTRGLIELYEASFWGTEGENALYEGGELSARMLSGGHSRDLNADFTLRHPLHRSLPNFNKKNYLNNVFGGHSYYNDALADLARFDFNVNQSMHREEINQVSRWWKEVGLAEELKFARNQTLKYYMWSLATMPEPKFSEERVEMTKPSSFVYLIDDIFDIYGSLDELILFTEIVDRWDIAAAEQLPDYMRNCFMALDKFTNQFGHKVYKRHGLNPIHYLRQAWAKMIKAFLVEAKWFKSRVCPKAEEYLRNGIVSSSVQLVLVHLFFLLGDDITQRNVELINGDNPPLVSSVGKILRLSDDLSAMVDSQKLLRVMMKFYVAVRSDLYCFECRARNITGVTGHTWITT
ncbi:(3S,6E)-nerolidol synthase 1 [Linum grandiflorum]